MTKPSHGIQGEFNVTAYNQMQRRLRDRGWIETNALIKFGISQGYALEVGPGPGYLGLEWLKRTQGTMLKGLDISPDMIALAERNAQEYGLADRIEYVHGGGDKIPLDDNTFDAVFTNGSLHEWADPKNTFNEIWRVLKPGGRALISDLRRDMFALIRWFLWNNIEPRGMRTGFDTSVNATYTPDELKKLVRGTKLESFQVSSNPFGLVLTGVK
jgi:ubiquinone/menaquinone biosynthesis C-methylase UbiE